MASILQSKPFAQCGCCDATYTHESVQDLQCVGSLASGLPNSELRLYNCACGSTLGVGCIGDVLVDDETWEQWEAENG
jgi:hypothetical protein